MTRNEVKSGKELQEITGISFVISWLRNIILDYNKAQALTYGSLTKSSK